MEGIARCWRCLTARVEWERGNVGRWESEGEGLLTVDSHCDRGFEQGPIRPPSEARSLLLRVSRNCPWNRCLFCPVYKGAKFSLRTVEQVTGDIDLVYRHVEALRQDAGESGHGRRARIRQAAERLPLAEAEAFAAALNWITIGKMRSVFLQDADALARKTPDLVAILEHLKARFPSVERVTSYARARTVEAKKDGDLKALKNAGLTRLHLGLESGSDQVLAMVKKGVTKKQQIAAGLKVKEAGIELSEYVMPGLGGQALSRIHALETADALNQINPDFIRIRTLAMPPHVPLFAEYEAGRFEKCTDLMMAGELLTFVESLDGITSLLRSDHILNLFADMEGTLPQDQDRMIAMLRTFLEMEPQRQRMYQVGRRLGLVSRIGDMEDELRLAQVERAYRELGINSQNVDQITDAIMAGYV